MPWLATDDDVLEEIIRTDALADGIDAAIKVLPNVPAATLAEWTPYVAGYRTWATKTKSDLSGMMGSFFGVPELGDQALAYEGELKTWQGEINAIAGRQVAPTGPSPIDIADANAALPNIGGGLGVEWGAGTVILAGLVILGLVIALAPERAIARKRFA